MESSSFRPLVKYGLRDLPTAIYPLDETAKEQGQYSEKEPHNRPVTLATTRHQEVFTFSRPNYDYDPNKNRPASTLTHPDLDPTGVNPYRSTDPSPVPFSTVSRVSAPASSMSSVESQICQPLPYTRIS